MLRKLLPHAVIILSFMYFVFFFIDRVNSAMVFIDNGITKGLLFILGVFAIIESLLIIHDDRNNTRLIEKKRQEREAARHQALAERRTDQIPPTAPRRTTTVPRSSALPRTGTVPRSGTVLRTSAVSRTSTASRTSTSQRPIRRYQ